MLTRNWLCGKIINKERSVLMASIFDVAKYVLDKLGCMSTWKMQKLCYYSQAWSLAWTGEPIFNEDFEAWANGPVCPELFRIGKGKFLIESNDVIYGNVRNLSDDQIDTINVVLRDYGDMKPYELRDLSHAERPWIDARHDCPDGDRCQTIITKDAMGSYYGEL